MKRITTLASLLLITTTVMADNHGQSMDLFLSLDANGDQYITKDEAVGHEELLDQFDKIDFDQDGRLSKAEFDLFNMQ